MKLTPTSPRKAAAVAARVLVLILVLAGLASAQSRARRALSPADIDAVAQLLMLEDTRRFDAAALGVALRSPHPEVRRRAVLAVGRIANPQGGALLTALRTDPDPEVVATVAFATGQLKEQAATTWLAARLRSPRTAVAREAAIALGKMQGPAARAALSAYLKTVVGGARTMPVVAEALLALGRFTATDDLSPVTRWVGSRDAEIRWRAAWALYRPRSPAAFPYLLKLSADDSPEVRFWAVRGLVPPSSSPSAAAAGAPGAATTAVSAFDRTAALARLRGAVQDPDRRVRTEALRALAQYDDDDSFTLVMAALESDDAWLAVSAAEAMARYKGRAAAVVPRLIAATSAGRPLSVRITSLAPLTTLSPPAALQLAGELATDANVAARAAGRQALGRLGGEGRARLDALTAADAPAPAAAPGGGSTAPHPRSLADYRRLVERWIVPDYAGAPKPRAVWDTPRGAIELELYAGDAPLGMEELVRLVESGDLAGTPFTRVVPNFVAQQRAVRGAVTLRDEVNRRGLTRGNLSWASAGLDTGRPGYTLGSTPQPHNEGNFTALGRVVLGMDVVDRLELGDVVSAARMQR